MARILVVANLTLGGDELMSTLRNRVSEGDCRIDVLVPASPNPAAWTHTEQDDLAAAQRRLDAALKRFAGLGCPVDGEIGDGRVVDAVLDVLRREQFDEVILSTLPPGASRWLRTDLIHRVERAVDIPVTHVVGAADGASA